MTDTTIDTAALLKSQMTADNILPQDYHQAALVGRVWRPGLGACVVRINADKTVTDITESYRTVSRLTNEADPAKALREAKGENIGTLQEVLDNAEHDKNRAYLLAPNDYQTIKAAGVTFVKSLVERMVEEGVKGENNPEAQQALRSKIWGVINGIVGEVSLTKVQPGSELAMQLFYKLTNAPLKDGETAPVPDTRPYKEQPGLGLSPHYPRVGLDKLAEIFSKAPTMTAVGSGAKAGYNEAFDGEGVSISWTNPEPEIVSILNNKGKLVGAALGNDVNDRLLEGKSALYLGIAKDEACTCGVGPFIRLFDENFKESDINEMNVRLQVKGLDGFTFDESNKMNEISRTPQSMGDQLFENHDFPDGALLFNGTMIIPSKRGDAAFTHKEGDLVFISEPKLGSLGMTMHPAAQLAKRPHDEPSLNEFLDSHVERAVKQALAAERAKQATGPERFIGSRGPADQGTQITDWL